MESIFLNKNELTELTGRRLKAAQTEWLKKNRWVYVLDMNNAPRVARQYALSRLGVGESVKPVHTAFEPNFAAIRKGH